MPKIASSLAVPDGGFLRTTLVRSPIGTSKHMERVLQGLGHNGKMGRQRIHRDDPSILGAIKMASRHLGVEIVAPGQEVAPMKSSSYAILDRPALRLTGPHGQYALAELYKGYFSLRWSSALPASRVFFEFSRFVDERHPFSVLVDTKVGRSTFHDLDEARSAIIALPVTQLIIDYARGTLHWENIAGSPLHEVGILSPELGRDTFRSLVKALGTPAISDSADNLVDKFAFIWD